MANNLLATRVLNFSQETMTVFAELPAARHPDVVRGVRNHHTNPEVAAQMGLPKTVAQSMQYCGLVVDALFERFGLPFLTGGRMEMKFFGPVFADDLVTVEVEQVDAEGWAAVRVFKQTDGGPPLQVAAGRCRVP